MTDRKSFVSTLWLASSLALLALVLAAPVRTTGFVTVPAQPECCFRCFVPPLGQFTTHLNAAVDTGAALQVNALPSENEEQDRADALDEPRDPFLIPCSFRKILDRRSIARRSIPSLYPLRC